VIASGWLLGGCLRSSVNMLVKASAAAVEDVVVVEFVLDC